MLLLPLSARPLILPMSVASLPDLDDFLRPPRLAAPVLSLPIFDVARDDFLKSRGVY
jgi:hypothetical protein